MNGPSAAAGVSVLLFDYRGYGGTIVPAGQSRRLHDAALEPKRYVEVPGAGHDDWQLLAGHRLVREVVAAARGRS